MMAVVGDWLLLRGESRASWKTSHDHTGALCNGVIHALVEDLTRSHRPGRGRAEYPQLTSSVVILGTLGTSPRAGKPEDDS